MVMCARKQQRLSDGCHDQRGDSQPFQALKYSSKSHPSSGDHRHEKMRDAADPSPPNKMLRRSNSPENKYCDSTGHNKAKNVHTQRVREREGGTSYSPQENSHNHSALHSSNSHSSNPSNNPSKTSDAPYDSADDWSEHISSSRKKNTTTIVVQKFHSGRNQKSGLKENRDKKKQINWQLMVSRKTEITEER